MSLVLPRSLTGLALSSQLGTGLSRTARLFVPAYGSRTAIRLKGRALVRPNLRRELARRISPRRQSS